MEALVTLSRGVQRLHIDAEPDRFVEPSSEILSKWWTGRLQADGWRAFVAEVDGRCRGYLLFELIDRPAETFTAPSLVLYVHHIGVDPAVRHRGIGRQLLEAVESEATVIGADQVALDTWSFNATAQASFASCGYEVYNLRLRRRLKPSERGARVFSLHHVQLAIPADGEDRARVFYGNVLGLDEIPKPPALAARGGVWFRHGDLELHLGVEEPCAPATKAHPGILTDDLAALRTRLLNAGVEVRSDELFPGFHRFYIDDCFGNRLEFLQPVP